MNHTRRVFVCLLGLVVILSILVFPISAQGNDSGAVNNTENETVNYENATFSPPQQNVYDLFIESQRNFDRSLSVLNTVATLIAIMGAILGIMVAILAIFIAAAAYLGFSEIKNWLKIRKDVEKKAENVTEIINKTECELGELRNVIPQTLLDEKPAQDILSKFEEYGNRLDTLELLGVSLKPEDYINRGNDLVYKNDFGSALKAYEKAIGLKPDNAVALSNKGATLGKLGRYEEALKGFDKAIDLKPDYVTALSNKGATLGKLGRYEEALKASEKVIKLKPDYTPALSSKGASLGKLGRYEEALKAFDKAIDLKPDYDEAWFNRACVYSLMGNKEKAMSDLEKAIELDKSRKEKAKKDEDFKNLWDDEDFKKLVE